MVHVHRTAARSLRERRGTSGVYCHHFVAWLRDFLLWLPPARWADIGRRERGVAFQGLARRASLRTLATSAAPFGRVPELALRAPLIGVSPQRRRERGG